MMNSGLSAAEVGHRLGITRNAVLGAIFRHEKPEHVRAYHQAMYVSRRTPRPSVLEVLPAAPDGLSRNEMIVWLVGAGCTFRDIGDLFDITYERVRQIAKKAGVRSAVAHSNGAAA